MKIVNVDLSKINLVGEIQIRLKLRLNLSSPVSLEEFLNKLKLTDGTSSMIYYIYMYVRCYNISLIYRHICDIQMIATSSPSLSPIRRSASR